MRYYAVEFFRKGLLEHNGIMTPEEAFAYLMQAIDGDGLLMNLAYEVEAAYAAELTPEERGLSA